MLVQTKKNENLPFVFTFFIELKVKKFHVVMVQKPQRIELFSCCFTCAVLDASWSV